MKKRIISLVLVVMMLVSLVPTGALAAGSGTTITQQPTDASADIGGSAEFSVNAENPNSTELKYLWFDADKVNTNDIDFSDIKGTIDKLEAAKLGEERVLRLTNIEEKMDGLRVRCAVYYQKLIVPRDLTLSNSAVLHLKAAPCAEHSFVLIPETQATCAKGGNIAYYYCTVCLRYYIDDAGVFETTPEECKTEKLTTHGDIILVPAKEESCAQTGCVEHYECELCGKYFTDETGTTELDASAVEIAEDPAKHSELEHFERVEPTCSKQGTIEHWYCTGCGNYYTDAAGTEKISKLKLDIDKDKTKHTALEEHAAVAPTCTEKGNIPYWSCADCGNYFSDENGQNEINKSDVKLDAKGHSNQWTAFESNGVEYHAEKCSDCGAMTNTGSHTGGTATCTAKAVCTKCGFEYGSIDGNNHVNTVNEILVEPTPEKDGVCNVYCNDCQKTVAENVTLKYKDICEHTPEKIAEVPAQCETTGIHGVKEHYKCTGCGTLFSDAECLNEIENIKSLDIEPYDHYIQAASTQVANLKLQTKAYDSIGHWSVCKYCDFRYTGTYSEHSFLANTKPTCHSGKICLACPYDDGARDYDNHDGGTEVRGANEPEGSKPGYTGDTYCLGCEKVIEQGRYYYTACSGGCANTLSFVKGYEKTCENDGRKDHYVCTVCNNMYLDDKATISTDANGIIDKCTGHDLHPGKDTLTNIDLQSLAKIVGLNSTQIAELIKNGTFDLEHVLDLVHIKDIDHCYDDVNHWLGCQRCGLTLSQLRDELESNGITINQKWYELSEKAAHAGGTATCNAKAVCTECGEGYGQFGSHRYDAVVTAATCTTDGYTTHTCSACNDSYVDSHTAKTGHLIVKGQCSLCNGFFKNPFYDVRSTAYYYSAVMWAYYYTPQITSGTEENYFSPTEHCTRSQVVTFLWRAAGCPEPTSTAMPFKDVKRGEYYYKAVLWALETGITEGVDKTHFAPLDEVTRGQFVTFLWRYFGSPSPTNMSNGFKDVYSRDYYYKAVLWASENGITNGTGNGKFSPENTCERCEVVSFMYRAIGGGK